MTRAYIKKQGILKSHRSIKSITIEFSTHYKMEKFKDKLKYQSRWTWYSSGFRKRINIDKKIERS
jgi:hypothetical protein